MASNYTENYQLPLWAANDAFLRTEFNDANQKIDAALASASADRMFVGSYTGNGQNNRTIQLPCTPKLFIVFGNINGNAALGLYTQQAGRFLTNGDCGESDYDLALEGSTVQIRNKAWHNASGKTVTYIAFA